RTDDAGDGVKSLRDGGFGGIRRDSSGGRGVPARAGLPHVRGQYVIIQDADLEYNPQEYTAMLDAVRESEGVVYGSRNLNGSTGRSYYRYWFGGVRFSFFPNGMYGLGFIV